MRVGITLFVFELICVLIVRAFFAPLFAVPITVVLFTFVITVIIVRLGIGLCVT